MNASMYGVQYTSLVLSLIEFVKKCKKNVISQFFLRSSNFTMKRKYKILRITANN